MVESESIAWEELVQRIQQNNPEAEEYLSAYFHPRITAMATVGLGNAETAREIAQETLLAVVQAVRGSKLREPEKLPGFVYGTARNLVNNYLRAAGQRPSHVPLDPNQAGPGNLPAELDLEDRRRIVRAALESINPLDRKILLLTLEDGMNPREIAPQVGLSAENVRTRKARAIKAIIAEVEKLSRR